MADYALQLVEQVQFWIIAGVAKLPKQQAGSQPVNHFRLADVRQMPDGEVDWLANDRAVRRVSWADELRRQPNTESAVNFAVSRSSGSSTR